MLIRYPLGLPYNLIRDFDDANTVYVVLAANQLNTAMTSFAANGVDTSKVRVADQAHRLHLDARLRSPVRVRRRRRRRHHRPRLQSSGASQRRPYPGRVRRRVRLSGDSPRHVAHRRQLHDRRRGLLHVHRSRVRRGALRERHVTGAGRRLDAQLLRHHAVSRDRRHFAKRHSPHRHVGQAPRRGDHSHEARVGGASHVRRAGAARHLDRVAARIDRSQLHGASRGLPQHRRRKPRLVHE